MNGVVLGVDRRFNTARVRLAGTNQQVVATYQGPPPCPLTSIEVEQQGNTWIETQRYYHSQLVLHDDWTMLVDQGASAAGYGTIDGDHLWRYQISGLPDDRLLTQEGGSSTTIGIGGIAGIAQRARYITTAIDGGTNSTPATTQTTGAASAAAHALLGCQPVLVLVARDASGSTPVVNTPPAGYSLVPGASVVIGVGQKMFVYYSSGAPALGATLSVVFSASCSWSWEWFSVQNADFTNSFFTPTQVVTNTGYSTIAQRAITKMADTDGALIFAAVGEHVLGGGPTTCTFTDPTGGTIIGSAQGDTTKHLAAWEGDLSAGMYPTTFSVPLTPGSPSGAAEWGVIFIELAPVGPNYVMDICRDDNALGAPGIGALWCSALIGQQGQKWAEVASADVAFDAAVGFDSAATFFDGIGYTGAYAPDQTGGYMIGFVQNQSLEALLGGIVTVVTVHGSTGARVAAYYNGTTKLWNLVIEDDAGNKTTVPTPWGFSGVAAPDMFIDILWAGPNLLYGGGPGFETGFAALWINGDGPYLFTGTTPSVSSLGFGVGTPGTNGLSVQTLMVDWIECQYVNRPDLNALLVNPFDDQPPL